jgi:hypothetical protein
MSRLIQPAAPLPSRREMLCRAGLGFGAWALLDLLTRDGRTGSASTTCMQRCGACWAWTTAG